MTLSPEELAFKARALAQAHPLTPLAKRFVDRVIEDQRGSQPVAEVGIWAGAGLTNGYCLRRVEEDEAGMVLSAVDEPPLDVDQLDEQAGLIAADLRNGTGGHVLGGDERLIAALDRIIASEVDRRLENWRDSVDESAWGELEEYITWFAVKGYAVRVAERASGAVA